MSELNRIQARTSNAKEQYQSYRNELQESIEQITKEIARRTKNLFPSSADFEQKYSEIHSLRATLEAKKSRIANLGSSKNYLPPNIRPTVSLNHFI